MIKFESVSKTFRDGTAAVVDLSLTAPSGKITVIVGPSGCGKTTTLRMVNRMLEPTSGRILWDGTPLKSRRKTTLRRQMGYVIQSGGLFPHRTVVENIGTVPRLLRWSKDKTDKRSLELLHHVGLDRKLAHRYPAQLSGGQQQRVGVARALAADPLVLLMDEPFSAVDPVVRSELHDFFLGLQKEISKTIILITHDIDEAIKLGDQVAILRVGGRLAQVGTPQQVLDEPADAFVEGFVGKDRGYRSLSFLPASDLELEKVKVVRDVESAETGEPTLVVDGDARPVGWASPDQPGLVFPLGATFNAESDTLRTALDSALTSLYSLAVAVSPDSGRFAGVVSARKILDRVAVARVAAAEESLRDREPGDPRLWRPAESLKPSSRSATEPSLRDEELGERERSRPDDSVEPSPSRSATEPSLRDEERGERERSRPDDSVEPSPPSSGRFDGAKRAALDGESAAQPATAEDATPREPVEGPVDTSDGATEPAANRRPVKSDNAAEWAGVAARATGGRHTEASSEPKAEQTAEPREPAPETDQEAQIVTVVSGEPVDLRPTDAAAAAGDEPGPDADVVDDADEPVDAAPTDTAVEREPERDSVR